MEQTKPSASSEEIRFLVRSEEIKPDVDSGEIKFKLGSEETPILFLKGNGDILVKGRLVDNDAQVVEALRDFLTVCNNPQLKTSILESTELLEKMDIYLDETDPDTGPLPQKRSIVGGSEAHEELKAVLQTLKAARERAGW